MAKKQKIFLCRLNGRKGLLPGLDISVLQHSGCKVKIIRKATNEDIQQYSYL